MATESLDWNLECFHTNHFILSLGPEEKVELFNTSPISSLQKLKLFMVHM